MSIPTGAFKYLVLWPLLIASGVGVLAAALSAIASVIHFQILAALGFSLLAVVLDKTAFKWLATSINHLS